MEKRRIEEMVRGWFIGNFEPSVLKTEQFEVGILTHPAGEKWPSHYHAVATEYNVLIAGKMILQGQELITGDIFVLHPEEIADPTFLEDCTVLCVKTPSVKNDKFIVT
jgi:quercetin dioxygenase-like cupin family protein